MTEFTYKPTTAISDGQNGEGFVAGGIQAISNGFQLFGRAVTVKLPVGENGAVLQAILAAKPGDILVVDAKGDMNRAIAGDFVIQMMQLAGVGGLVVDGVIRDVEAVKNLHFPVFCKGITAVAGVKNGGGKVNTPVAIGGVSVAPGDYIVGDDDGVMVIPQASIEKVMAKTSDKMKRDEERERLVLQSQDTVRDYLKNVTQ